MAMEQEFVAKIMAFALQGWDWVQTNIMLPERLLELAVVVVAVLVAKIASGRIRSGIMKVFGHHGLAQKADRLLLGSILTSGLASVLMWTAVLIIQPFMFPYFISTMASLFTAWFVIRLAVSMIANRELARMVAVTAWTITALKIIGLLDPISTVLDSATLPLGETKISVLDIFQGVFTLGIMLWLALGLASLLEKKVSSLTSLPPSTRELMNKTLKIIIVSMAFLISLNATGIDLTALAVFGGALGVGIGFGLQKVVGNFISGIILLVDRSIKPGDVIETAGTYGTINKLAARYTSVITRDGTEFLIPNEDMITQPVINWSHSHLLVRRKIPVQVCYSCNIREAMKLMVEAALEEDRVLKHPEPKTLIKGFGADGVDLELRMWIEDPQNGVSNVASDVMLHIWDKFHEHDIDFPYPQRVVHLRKDDGWTVHAQPPVESQPSQDKPD